MKKGLLVVAPLLLCFLLQAQNQDKDKTAIEAQIDAMVKSWNNHNYEDLGNYTTENTDWVNNVGGKDEKNRNLPTSFITIPSLKMWR